MQQVRYDLASRVKTDHLLNLWDLVALFIIVAVIGTFAWGATQMASPYSLGDPIPIFLTPQLLPEYAVRTVLRMGIALLFSLLFTFAVGTWAAKSKRAELLLIPLIDVLQSVPVLSYLSITLVGFIALFPNSMLGPECASIFAIFTSQVWNMVLGFYQSLKTLPHELREASDMYQLSAWQRFWRVEVPFAMPTLLWNIMMSMSASWFFVVASEAISVSNQTILLPGIGSYIKVALYRENLTAIYYAIMAMFAVILFYDQLLFRPLLYLAEKYQLEQDPDSKQTKSWFVNLLQNTRWIKKCSAIFTRIADAIINIRLLKHKPAFADKNPNPRTDRTFDIIFTGIVVLSLLASTVLLMRFIWSSIPLNEVIHVTLLGCVTGVRVFVLIAISSIIWLPIGIWIGLRPRVAAAVMPIVQFAASFPVNLFYPLFFYVIVHYRLDPEIWLTPLMILGSQWYILFNVISGAMSLPKELNMAAKNFGLKGWQWWRDLALPGVFPHFITGAITAAGGAWNASIVAEWLEWGGTTISATGLGQYITANTLQGDFPRIALGTAMMCIFVLLFNRILWRPMYLLAQSRYGIN